MEENVLETIRQYNMLKQSDSVILGISGGADSLCLLIVLKKLAHLFDLKLIAVHVNHHIRGDEADKDQHFVEEFCAKLGVKCIVEHINANKLAEEMKCSCEEAGRIARYEIFEQERIKNNCNRIAVAHNKNDSVETILFNLARGTGIRGLTGIAPVRDRIIRPLINADRRDIEEYLKKEKVLYCTDSTNLEDEYSRNVIRNNILPVFRDRINTAVFDNISRAGAELAKTEEYLNEKINEAYEKYVSKVNDRIFINDEAYSEHEVIISGVIRNAICNLGGKLKDITRTHIKSVSDLFEKTVSKSVNLPYGIVAQKKYKGIELFIPENAKERTGLLSGEETVIWERESEEKTGNQWVEVKQLKYDKRKPQDLMYTKQIDCDKIKNRLVIRTRREGDYILIKGSAGNPVKKKLKKFFVDEKIPKEDRNKILLVADGSSIVWIIGERLSEGYKIGEETKVILELTYGKDC